MDRIENFEKYLDELTMYTFNGYIKNNDKFGLCGLLLGNGHWKAESFPGAGHNYLEVLNSIYRYSINNPEVNVANILEEILNFVAMYFGSLEEFLMIMNYVYLQLDNEKNNKSPFKINVIRILNALKSNILSDSGLYQNKMFIEQVHKSEEYLNQNYGHKIL